MAKLSNFPYVDLEELDVACMDWECAPCGVTRDSEPLTCANFDALCDRLEHVDPEGDTWEIVRFGHFAVGWVDEIFVAPDSDAANLCKEIRASMANYPCLDEGLWSLYETEAENEKAAAT